MKHKGCPLFKEAFLHLIYICMNPPPGRYLCRYEKRQKSPSTSCHQDPKSDLPLPQPGPSEGSARVRQLGAKLLGPLSAPPSLCSAERSETKQKAQSVALWGLPGSRTAAGTGASHSSGFPASGKCQYFKSSHGPGFVCLCLF